MDAPYAGDALGGPGAELLAAPAAAALLAAYCLAACVPAAWLFVRRDAA